MLQRVRRNPFRDHLNFNKQRKKKRKNENIYKILKWTSQLMKGVPKAKPFLLVWLKLQLQGCSKVCFIVTIGAAFSNLWDQTNSNVIVSIKSTNTSMKPCQRHIGNSVSEFVNVKYGTTISSLNFELSQYLKSPSSLKLISGYQPGIVLMCNKNHSTVVINWQSLKYLAYIRLSEKPTLQFLPWTALFSRIFVITHTTQFFQVKEILTQWPSQYSVTISISSLNTLCC